MRTVLLPALVMSMDWVESGGSPKDQLAVSCQKPNEVPIQLFVWALASGIVKPRATNPSGRPTSNSAVRSFMVSSRVFSCLRDECTAVRRFVK